MSDIIAAAVKDHTLPAKALGVLTHMVYSDNPEESYQTVAEARPDGREAVRSAVLTLEAHGYLTRTKRRDANGKVTGATYTLHNPKEQA